MSKQHSLQPIEKVLKKFRSKFGHLAIFFYNEYSPEIISILWRPQVLQTDPFSAMHSEYKSPVDDKWEHESLVKFNESDVLREIKFYGRDIITNVKVLKKQDR